MNNQQLIAFIERDKTDTSTSSWVSPSLKYFYIGLGKTASSRIKLSLHKLEGHEATGRHFPWLHARDKPNQDFVATLNDFTTDEATQIMNASDWFRFCFVRNPYDRLFSAYKSFIMQDITPPSPFYNKIKDDIRRMYDYTYRAEKQGGTVTFRDFVQYVEDTIKQRRDYHWCTMTDGLRPDLINYDFVGYFEHFNRDFKHVLQQLGVDEVLIPDLLDPVNESNIKRLPLAAVYDWDLADRVYQLYKKDFETYGYERNSWLF